MLSVESKVSAGMVTVKTTSNGGLSPLHWAQRATEKLISVADSAPTPIRDQANMFRDRVEHVVHECIKQAIASDRTTLAAQLESQGHKEMAEIIRRL